MSRFFEPIGTAHLKAKLIDQFGEDEPGGDERRINVHLLREAVSKDVKVRFDLENTEAMQDGLCGYHTTPAGLSYLAMTSGGDWEVSVLWIVYWDGKKIRGYVPTEGNPWNRRTKEAYGNDDDEGPCEYEHEPVKIRADIEARIKEAP